MSTVANAEVIAKRTNAAKKTALAVRCWVILDAGLGSTGVNGRRFLTASHRLRSVGCSSKNSTTPRF